MGMVVSVDCGALWGFGVAEWGEQINLFEKSALILQITPSTQRFPAFCDKFQGSQRTSKKSNYSSRFSKNLKEI